jgi:hypothetical protein
VNVPYTKLKVVGNAESAWDEFFTLEIFAA